MEGGLPPDVSRAWRELLIRFLKSPKRVVACRPPLSPIANAMELTELARDWGAFADIAVVDNASLARFGIPEDKGSMSVEGSDFEVAAAAAFPSCPRLARFRDLMDVGLVSPGSQREMFWRDVIEPLSRCSSAVSVVDGYLFGRLWDDRRNPDHVVWLLEHLDDVVIDQATVTLFSRKGDGSSANAIGDRILRKWVRSSERRISSLRIVLVPDRVWMNGRPGQRGPMPHDRHIRFNVGGAIGISAGLDRLSNPTIWDPNGMKWDFKWDPRALEPLSLAEGRCSHAAGADIEDIDVLG